MEQNVKSNHQAEIHRIHYYWLFYIILEDPWALAISWDSAGKGIGDTAISNAYKFH